jgi:class 3 adenylate cyclase
MPALLLVTTAAAGDALAPPRRVGIGVIALTMILLDVWLLLRRVALVPSVVAAIALPGATFATIGFAIAGPRFAVAATVVPAVAVVGFVLAPRRTALLIVATLLVGFTVVVSTTDGYARPAAQMSTIAAFTVAAAGALHVVVGRVHVLANQLTDANARLQEYVAPQVAAAVRSATNLEPHRRQIAVWFCDLRGFTSFTAGAEPEEVVDVLGEYYAVVGDRATAAGATIGAFAGDGIHGYFGDPEPHPDPAGAAARLALELSGALERLAHRWSARGYELGHGIGIAYGYATLGTVGYEGRRDYTALGSVVNLAARLCGEAADGEILLDAKAASAASLPATTRAVTLKGFDRPITAHALTR